MGKDESGAVIEAAHSASEKNLMLALSGFGAMMENAYEETAPHKICSYIYELANAFNSFYHETKIMSEENEQIQKSYIRLFDEVGIRLGFRRRSACKFSELIKRRGCRMKWAD